MKDQDQDAEGVDLPEIEPTDLQLETLSGDIRDAMLMRVRDMKRPWSMLSEDEQRDLASGLELAASDIVGRAVRLLSSWEFPRAVVKLQDVKITGGDKAGISAKVECPNISEYRDMLGEHAGQSVMLVAVDSDNFKGERAPVEIDPDQPDLPESSDEDDGGIPDGFDDLVAKAEAYIRAEEKPTTSYIQRKLAIGYNNAARIMEALQERGVVSQPDAKGKRTILPPKPKGDVEGEGDDES